MPWHPPIPFGAFYTEDALQLGPALSLLGYCYDKVGRDGALRLNLRQAAGEMGVPYPTVKRWWELLKATDYIASYQDHRRGGLAVQMADTLLDWWREERYEKSIKNDTPDENIEQISNKYRSEKGSKMILKKTAYKVLSNTDQAESHGGGEDRDRTAQIPPPAIALLFAIFDSAEISVEQTDDLCSTVTDLALWREVLTTWRTNGYKPRIGNLLDRYRKEIGKENRNGTHPPSRHANAPSRRTGKVAERLDNLDE
jgi:hypothetical protein